MHFWEYSFNTFLFSDYNLVKAESGKPGAVGKKVASMKRRVHVVANGLESKGDLKQMNLRLIIFRRKEAQQKFCPARNTLQFVVVDADTTKSYPTNFVCRLPDYADGYGHGSVFSNLFENNEREVAKKLLMDALEREQDSRIKLAIEKRIKKLN